MSRSRSGKRRRAVARVILAGTAVALTSAGTAHAYVTKQTPLGAPVHWQDAHVSFVVDDSVTQAVPGATPAIAAAAQSWSGASGAPALSAADGEGGSQPTVDGKNTVLFAAGGYAPAGNALAVTVLSYDESTGAIVDADIVVNGKHAFAVLASGATAPAGAVPVSTEGSSGASTAQQVFDLQHVVAHEVGHALGLGDEASEPSDLMYPYSLPDDATVRSPASDDLAGIDSIYAGQTPTATSHSGCGGASVSGGRLGARDAWIGWALLGVAGAWLISRRGARVVVPCAAACVVFVGGVALARSAPESVAAVQAAADAAIAGSPDARARVTSVETTNVGGLFETVVELAPEHCAHAGACPAHVRAHAWGGTMGGITQQVGEMPAPRVDDEVDLAFTRDGRTDVSATLIAVRRP